MAGRIIASGLPSLYDGLPIRELSLVTLAVERPDPDDEIIARHADPERLAWMHANFTDRVRVTSLGDTDSYATRLFDYEPRPLRFWCRPDSALIHVRFSWRAIDRRLPRDRSRLSQF